MKNCCICERPIEDEENAPVLTMGKYANPRLLCPECSACLDRVTGSHDPAEVRRERASLGDLVNKSGTYDDTSVFETLKEIFDRSEERAAAIEAGTYDFSQDETDAAEGLEDIPEDMKETAEDRAKDEADVLSEKKLDKLLNIAWILVGVAAVALIVKFIFLR